MGATVTTQKRVLAKRVADQVFYWLLESRYEKNCYPHTPHESCIAFGRAEKVFPRMFAHAANCEGGMLQDRDGHIRPEGYIRDWLNKMANPEVVTSESVTLSVGGDWKTPIKDEHLDEVSSYLQNAGLADHAKCLTDFRKARFSFDVLDEMLALEHFAGNVSPWKIFRNLRADDHDASLGYVPPVGIDWELPESEVPKGVRLNGDSYALWEDGKLKPSGWAFSLVGKFIANEPGRDGFTPLGSLKRIRQYRSALSCLDMLDAKTQVFADIPRSNLADWEKLEWSPERLNERISDFADRARLVEDRGEKIVVQVLGSDAARFLPDAAEITATIPAMPNVFPDNADHTQDENRSRPRIAP
jgi:hypothetical protein